ncbi:type IV pilin [Salinigranum sp. GCM10025319]|uniref:type IV pilin n=1 Tax=Salinigranum sp. GCM10025319 TaxID=3252687 RepID=UPI00360780D5
MHPPRSPSSSRALTPVAGVLVVALTVSLAAVAAGAVFAVDAPDDRPARASLSLAVEENTLSLTHRGGDALDVRRLRLLIEVDGESLAHQPPVPFFSARGFQSGPTGPFNSATDPRWTAGETATLTVAGTNRPQLTTGGTVTVHVFTGDAPVAELRVTVD